MTPDFDDALFQAVHEGRDVRLVEADGYGYGIEIDGVTVVDGLVHETFAFPIHSMRLDPEASRLVEELVAQSEERARRRRRRREREQTETHRATHGAELPRREGTP